jgi:hypothetical protein
MTRSGAYPASGATAQDRERRLPSVSTGSNAVSADGMDLDYENIVGVARGRLARTSRRRRTKPPGPVPVISGGAGPAQDSFCFDSDRRPAPGRAPADPGLAG